MGTKEIFKQLFAAAATAAANTLPEAAAEQRLIAEFYLLTFIESLLFKGEPALISLQPRIPVVKRSNFLPWDRFLKGLEDNWIEVVKSARRTKHPLELNCPRPGVLNLILGADNAGALDVPPAVQVDISDYVSGEWLKLLAARAIAARGRSNPGAVVGALFKVRLTDNALFQYWGAPIVTDYAKNWRSLIPKNVRDTRPTFEKARDAALGVFGEPLR